MRRARKPEGRGEFVAIMLVCGIPLLLVGILATGVSVFDPPPDTLERVGAGSAVFIGLAMLFAVWQLTRTWLSSVREARR